MIYIKKLLPTVLIIYPASTMSVSIVYNMKIATITRRQKFEDDKIQQFHNLLSGTPFAQWRKTQNGNFKQNSYGVLGSYIYSKENHYLKIDNAIGRITSHITTDNNSLKISKSQTDDLLFTGGLGHQIGSRVRCAYSGLFGLPTHRNHLLEFSQLGIGHVGLGGQIDCAYNYLENNNNIIFSAIRLIHFFQRTVEVRDNCLKPLYTYNRYNLKPGNLADIFISHQTTWNKQNRFEYGYDLTLGFGANICPAIFNFASTAKLIRNSFFAVYSRFIPIHEVPSGIIIALSGGFDSKPKLIGKNYFLTVWGLWGFAF
jgi:hypothetical protein